MELGVLLCCFSGTHCEIGKNSGPWDTLSIKWVKQNRYIQGFIWNLNEWRKSRWDVYDSDIKCSSQICAFDHLVPSWHCCFRRLGRPWDFDTNKNECWGGPEGAISWFWPELTSELTWSSCYIPFSAWIHLLLSLCFPLRNGLINTSETMRQNKPYINPSWFKLLWHIFCHNDQKKRT